VIYEAFPVETVKPPRRRHSSDRGTKKAQIGMTRQRRLLPSGKDAGTGVRKKKKEQMRNHVIRTDRQWDISITRDERGRAHSHMGDNKNVYNINHFYWPTNALICTKLKG